MAYTYITKVSQNLVTLNVTVTSVRCKNRLETEILFSRVYYQDFPTENVLFTKKNFSKSLVLQKKKQATGVYKCCMLLRRMVVLNTKRVLQFFKKFFLE